jgi:hypothetical protein
MPVRTSLDIPDALHDELRHRAERSGTSIDALIVSALEQVYCEGRKSVPVTGPLVRGRVSLARSFLKTRTLTNSFCPDWNASLAFVAGQVVQIESLSYERFDDGLAL